MGDKEEIFWVGEPTGNLSAPVGVKRKARTKKVEFVGWGSRPLFEFLESVGSDTSKKISRYDVADIVNKYVNDRKLLHPVKKKRIVCDESLLSLFGRKTIAKNKVYDMLGSHFAENQVDSDDDFLFSSEEDVASENQKKPVLERKPSVKKLKTPKSEFAAIITDNIKLIYLRRSLVQELLKDSETFKEKIVGSIVRVKSDPYDYLQKNSHMLVQVTGLKNTPGSDNNSTEIILQVTNIMKDVHISMLSEDNFSEEECKDLCQRIKDGLLKRPTIVELQQKVQVLHKDVTNHWLVKELALLEKKIERANEKGWRRELFEYLERKKLLQTPDEQARLLREVPEVIPEAIEVEGAMDEFPDDIEKQDLSSPESTSNVNGGWKILKQDAGTPQTLLMTGQNGKGNLPALALAKQNSEKDVRQSLTLGQGDAITDTKNNDFQHFTISRELKQPTYIISQSRGTLQTLSMTGQNGKGNPPALALAKQNSDKDVQQSVTFGQGDAIADTKNYDFHHFTISGEQKLPTHIISQSKDLQHAVMSEEQRQPTHYKKDFQYFTISGEQKQPPYIISQSKDLQHAVMSEEQRQPTHDKIDFVHSVILKEQQPTYNGFENKSTMNCHNVPIQPRVQTNVPVIELSDDEDEEKEDSSSDIEILDYGLESLIWHYMDPQGIVQGPFSLRSLKRWYDDGYFRPDFKVWKAGQTENEAVTLSSILQGLFRN